MSARSLRLGGVVAAVVLLLGCAAPGQQTPGQPTPGQPTPGQPTPGQATPGQPTPGQETPGQPTPQGETRTLSLAHSYADHQPQARCGAQVIADEVAGSNVGLTIEIFGQSVLGSDAERVQSVVAGDIDLDIQGASALTALYEPMGAVDGAFVFDDSDHMHRFFAGEASQPLKDGFYDATGVTILGGWDTGARHFTANRPIRTPDDLEGLRMRFPPSPTFLLNARAMGANAVEVAFEELYLALQQGTVDGQENPLVNIEGRSFYEVQDYISMSAHQLSSNLVIIGPVWDELSAEQQQALLAATERAMVTEPECVVEAEAEILEEWRTSDAIEIIEDVDRDAFRSRVEPYLRDNFTPGQIEVLDAIRSVANP
jgi:TRAP-type transport system periplasmic protein